ncbi:hypothetical protein OSTOST_17716 [Ostertagia ostertagi]
MDNNEIEETKSYRVNCDDCCEEDLCNANFSVQYYQEMMSRQYTSWFTPLPGEAEHRVEETEDTAVGSPLNKSPGFSVSAEKSYKGILAIIAITKVAGAEELQAEANKSPRNGQERAVI